MIEKSRIVRGNYIFNTEDNATIAIKQGTLPENVGRRTDMKMVEVGEVFDVLCYRL